MRRPQRLVRGRGPCGGQGLAPLAKEAGLTLSQFAIAWTLRSPHVASAIIGASRPEQVMEYMVACGRSIDRALFDRGEALLLEAMSPAARAMLFGAPPMDEASATRSAAKRPRGSP